MKAAAQAHRPIGVGIIGASPDHGWAATAHIPALSVLPDFALRAVSTTRRESADAAARTFGADHAFDHHEELVGCPDVDLVVVTVKVPHHLELVSAAIRAGKAVYCEWPLGANLDEAEAMADLAARADAPTMIGLQARSAPAVGYVRDLVADGQLGDVLSTTMTGTSRPGTTVPRAHAYLADPANGATALTIAGGHSLDVMCHCLGEFDELSSITDIRLPVLRIKETGEPWPKTAPDQVAVIGRLDRGVTASAHFREGVSGHSAFLWEINGTKGTVQVTARHAHPGIYPMAVTVSLAGETSGTPVDIPSSYGVPAEAVHAVESLGDAPAANIARSYARLARDLRDGGRTVPTFADALVRHRMISAIESSAHSGTRLRTQGDADPEPVP
ncbi:Gfo/Idh/MocA family oxidoreductase [Streptomyces sp. NPDC051572]|uniref:Gfo/Idh/MocA family protein n=1 Tax=unclassified Streptomyces TaxID=2593676 RepID=UPI00344D47F2